MMGRPTSIVMGEDLADIVARHRAETAAKLEGKIDPIVPISRQHGAPSKKREGRAPRDSHGVKGSTRDSKRDSRLSMISQHLAISAATTGAGHGPGALFADLQASQHEESCVSHRQSIFHEDIQEQRPGNPVPPQQVKRWSRWQYSMINPGLGLGHGVHNDDEAVFSEQANYIRAMIESGNFDMRHLRLTKEAASDPAFQTALHAALESFPPGVAAQIIEEAHLHEDIRDEDVPKPVSPLRRARHSIQIASRTAWQDIRTASNRWSRIGPQRLADIRGYEKPRLARRVWSRVSWNRKPTQAMAF
ncbi:hypothetical protein JX265_006475 [Neoarthrinium moseri]|uniref:Uncharacterized protein n=1 Tax=Neoarthrinium moseri TaxID=1658444 RepID=A0A9P9WLJ3_9PEZI|nr:hypothetical protein JX265_006475 [Neoarthrinium moseri]